MSRPDPIPLKMIRCSEVVDAPGMGVAQGISANARIRLEYWPWLRHHRIEFIADPAKPPVVSFIPETKVCFWIPLEPLGVPAAAAAMSPPARK